MSVLPLFNIERGFLDALVCDKGVTTEVMDCFARKVLVRLPARRDTRANLTCVCCGIGTVSRSPARAGGGVYRSLSVVACAAPAGWLKWHHLGPGDVVVLDNASIHSNQVMAKIVHARGATLLFTPPYSPQYNPVRINGFPEVFGGASGRRPFSN